MFDHSDLKPSVFRVLQRLNEEITDQQEAPNMEL